jgi:DNA repair protein RadC
MAAQVALEHRTPIRDSGTVARWGQARLGWLDHEELWLLALDGHHQLRAARRVHIGGLGGMSLALRDPLRVALREGASAVVLVHNHPSGNPSPSEEDLRFTLAFEEAAQLVGTPLLDHVIVARHSHTSMVDDRWFVHRQAAHRTSSKCPVNEPGRES